MQSHTCTALGSLSFRCGDHPSLNWPQVFHAVQPPPAFFGLGCYMPTSFRMVRPRTTSYWERSGSDTICNAADCFRDDRLPPQTNTGLFSMLWPHSHAFWETSQK